MVWLVNNSSSLNDFLIEKDKEAVFWQMKVALPAQSYEGVKMQWSRTFPAYAL
jgi:hypothetical protein